MDEKLLSILACPVTHAPLRFDQARSELISESAGLAYTMIEGIPDLVPGRARMLGGSGESVPQKERLEESHEYAKGYHEARRTVPGTVVYEEYWNNRLIDLLPQGRHLRALDLMCGEGIFLPVLEQLYDEVIGMDLSMEMLRLVETERRFRIFAGDALRTPFVPASFDVIVVRGGLHHLPDRLSEVFSEVRRILRPGGRLVFLEPCDDNWMIRVFRRFVYRTSAHFDEDEERGLTTQELRGHLEKNGFRLLRVERSGFLGYALLLNTDMNSFLRTINSLPWSRFMAKVLIGFDSLWEKTPVIRALTFNLFLSAQLKDENQ